MGGVVGLRSVLYPKYTPHALKDPHEQGGALSVMVSIGITQAQLLFQFMCETLHGDKACYKNHEPFGTSVPYPDEGVRIHITVMMAKELRWLRKRPQAMQKQRAQ